MKQERLKKLNVGMALSLILLMLFMRALCERAPWDCPECGRKGNTGNFCGWCAYPAPTMETTSPISFEVGKIVLFGRYEQDNNTENGPEEIEWIVLECDEANRKALLISKYGLDAKPYSTAGGRTTWENSTLRSWLNNEFLNTAFNSKESAAIVITELDNSARQGYWGIDENNTKDQVFLLSYAEANRYFDVSYGPGGNMKSRVALSPSVWKRGNISSKQVTEEGLRSGLWWLRSQGNSQNRAAIVDESGMLGYCSVGNGLPSVRSAVWIELGTNAVKR